MLLHLRECLKLLLQKPATCLVAKLQRYAQEVFQELLEPFPATIQVTITEAEERTRREWQILHGGACGCICNAIFAESGELFEVTLSVPAIVPDRRPDGVNGDKSAFSIPNIPPLVHGQRGQDRHRPCL
jgi:hypothetical protein